MNATMAGAPTTGFCPRCMRRLLARAEALLHDATKEPGATPGERAFETTLALGCLAAAEDHARGLGARSPVPVGGVIAARVLVERGQAAAAREAARLLLEALSKSQANTNTETLDK